MKPALSLVTLGVADFKKSLSFYQDGLGWPTDAKPTDPVAFFQLSGLVLGLFPREELAKDAKVSPEGSGFRGISLAHNVGSEKEVDEAFAFALKAGGKPVKQPGKVSWGGYSCYFSDPDGFLWEIAYNPFWGLTPDGRVTLTK